MWINDFLARCARHAAVALLALGALTSFAQQAQIDRVVAIVDDDVVLKSEFDARWVQVEEQLAQATGPLPPVEELRKQVLDQIILEHLQLQMAQRAGVRVDDNQLNQTLASIAQQNNMDFGQFQTALQQQGLYETTRESIRKELLIRQFQNGAVNRRIDVTRQEVENYLRSEAGLATIAPEYHVAHVQIPANGGSTPERQAELMDQLREQIVAGGNILQMAAARQISGITVTGGDLGWAKPENLPSVYANIVPALETGEVSEPISSSYGLHLVQVLETRGGSALRLNQSRVRHILIKPNEIRTDAQAEALIRSLYQRIRDGEDFEDIARQNTDDDTSMVSGGNLEWISDGQFPPDFMAVVNATAVGQMTEPFKATTGWHIVEVLDRRVQDVTEENKRFQAQQILRQRKFENELENWLTEIRDEAYVDIKEF